MDRAYRVLGVLLVGGGVTWWAADAFAEWSGFPFLLCAAAFGWFLVWKPARLSWG